MEAYEPYRVQVRGLLLLLAYGMAFVYIVKKVVSYGATQTNGELHEQSNKK